MLQNLCKTLGFKKNMVYKIPPGGGGKPYPASGLIVKGRETFYRRHTVPITSCSEVKYVLKRVSFGSKDCTKELKLECAYFLGQTS